VKATDRPLVARCIAQCSYSRECLESNTGRSSETITKRVIMWFLVLYIFISTYHRNYFSQTTDLDPAVKNVKKIATFI
jgi:hypothetical protein